jgi:hypothetical protein
MIVSHEATLAKGTTYRFKTQPVDPYDAFRGRYVQLGFVAARAEIPEGLEVERGQRVYVPLTTDAEGFAGFGPVSSERPGGDYLRVRLRYVDRKSATLVLPFDRFYMEEEAAPKAERLYRRSGQRPAYATVAVYRGRAALQDLFIDGMPVIDRLELGTRQPFLGSWVDQAANGESDQHDLVRIDVDVDGTAVCTFGPYQPFQDTAGQAGVAAIEVSYRHDEESTPQRLTLGPFDDGPYAGQLLFGTLEFNGEDQFQISFEAAHSESDATAVSPGSIALGRQTFTRAWP